MKEQKLYHYCRLSTAIEHILPNRQLLLSPLRNTNDPRENRTYQFKASGYSFYGSTLEAWCDVVSDEIKKITKVLCFCEDKNPYFGYELSRMWALYGGNHKGVCLEINKEAFISENLDKIHTTHLRPINYWELDVNQPIEHKEIDLDKIHEFGVQDYLVNHFLPVNIDLLFTKNSEWSSEHEHRLIYMSNDPNNEYCSIKNSLTSIYLGIDFNDNYLPSIKIHSDKIPIHKMDFIDVRLQPNRI